MATENLDMDYSKYDFKDSTEMYVHLSKKGLSKDTVREISKLKDEPQWMLDFRLRAYDAFMKKPMPQWGGDLNNIDFQNIETKEFRSEKNSSGLYNPENEHDACGLGFIANVKGKKSHKIIQDGIKILENLPRKVKGWPYRYFSRIIYCMKLRSRFYGPPQSSEHCPRAHLLRVCLIGSQPYRATERVECNTFGSTFD